MDSIHRAVEQIKLGRPVIVVDDEARENEGDLIIAAEMATPDWIGFMVRWSSGFICAALAGTDCDRLDLGPMREVNEDKRGTAYTVTVDAAVGLGTGISAADRSRTLNVLADPKATASDLRRPGHVVPLRAAAGGVLERMGHTEAAVELAILAGLQPAGALAEVVSEIDPTRMALLPELSNFAIEHCLTVISIADLVAHRKLAWAADDPEGNAVAPR